ncbi:hypothetical protein C0992_011025, partial [Termitomyces sp. T32_za158]
MGRVNLAPGQILAVPEASRIRASQASSAAITRALQRARGPPLLAWCEANGPCHYCRRRNVDCVFEEPQEDSRRDSAVVAFVLRGGRARLGVGLGVGQGGEGGRSTAGGGGARRGSYGGGVHGNPGGVGVRGAQARASPVVPAASCLRGWPFGVPRLLARLGVPSALDHGSSESSGDFASGGAPVE